MIAACGAAPRSAVQLRGDAEHPRQGEPVTLSQLPTIKPVTVEPVAPVVVAKKTNVTAKKKDLGLTR